MAPFPSYFFYVFLLQVRGPSDKLRWCKLEGSEVDGAGGTKKFYITRSDLELPPGFDRHVLVKFVFFFCGAGNRFC